MLDQQNSYRQIMKATSIFGGVQVFQIILGIIRSKFIAILVGPFGIGISGLLTSTVGFISALTNFGISTSAVKDVSAAYATNNDIRLSIVAKVFMRWVWVTGFFGTIFTVLLSPWLSEITFGNRNYTYAFIWISITLLFNQISSGQSVMLRSMRQVRSMAKAGLYGSIIGLFTVIPLYYLYGIQGIVPGIVATSIISLITTLFYFKKLDIKPIYVSKVRTIAEGKGMLKMGFMISLSGLITLGAAYIVRIFISSSGGVEQVGLYSAGFAIINTYVGMIFNAMGTDYYPRLAAIANNKEKSNEVINQQAEIAILIIAPFILVFLVFINWIVILLYSEKFIAVNDMILYAALGMLFKAASWSVAFVFLAKGASKLFFWNELITNIYLLFFNIFGYKFFGLTGMGLSFLISYFIYFMQVFIVAKIKYQFFFSSEFSRIFVLQFGLALSCLLFVKLLSFPFSYVAGLLFIGFSVFFAFKGLDKRLDLRSYFFSYKRNV